ncbi:fimbria/pilus outer membrane usher protein [Citrobacter koseri]|uniref:fimbria/pilus outer membrane usher protein n=1 Tax=Citrobacter koseri TaxID=545 RepID=UPI00389A36DD
MPALNQSWQISVPRSLDNMGSLSHGGTHQTVWKDNVVNNQLSLGYSTIVKQVSVGVIFNIDRAQDEDGNWQKNRMPTLSLSIQFTVLSNDETGMSTSGNYGLSDGSQGGTTHPLSMNGNSQSGWRYVECHRA